MPDPKTTKTAATRKPKGVMHLAGRSGRTDCGKSVATKDLGHTPSYYYRGNAEAARRDAPLRTTTAHDEVTCRACQGGYEYQLKKRKREREALEARRTRTYRLSVSVEITAADADDADDQMCLLFSRSIRDKVSVEEVA